MLGDADELFKEMVERGVFPDYYTLTTLIHGYCKDGNMSRALDLFETMTQRSLKPDVVTYNTLMDVLHGEAIPSLKHPTHA